jgi:peptide/nickel transport system permease protein
VGNGLSLILYSMPYFVIGMPLIIIFAAELGWFPTSGMLDPGAHYSSPIDQLMDFLSHLILPLATVTLGLIGGYSILMRSAIIVGLAAGSYAGWRRGSSGDRVASGTGLILYSMPYFVIGMPLIIIFAANLGWFPTSGMLTPGAQFESFPEQLADFLSHLVLPLTTITLGLIGGYSIIMRSAIIETRSEDYVTTARAKGLKDSRILRQHAFPNALLPMVTIIAIQLGYVVAGAITAEVVFNWPGLGTLTVEALDARDYPVLQGIFLILAVTVVLANLAADIVYGRLDPRVRS